MGKRRQTWEVQRDDDTDVEDDIDIAQARQIHMSADGRRVHETPRSPQKRYSRAQLPHLPTIEESIFEGVEFSGDLAEDVNAPPTVGAKLARKRYPASDAPMKDWSSGFREEYLDEFIRLEGRGDAASLERCPSCPATKTPSAEETGPIYRCEDCSGCLMECRTCSVLRHERLPFHLVKKWNGVYFEKTTLNEMGLRYQLGHVDLLCSLPESAVKDFTVMHTNGIHCVAVNFCACDQKISRRQQLLREGWYPATVRWPQTCATAQLLKQFHILTLTGKIPAYDYYNALERLTDNTGVNVPKPRYKEFMRIVRQYRHLKMMKRSGRGNVLDGLKTTQRGDLAIFCLACPIPGVNLPEGWESVAPELMFLYALMVAVDANFRAKNLIRSSELADPGLHTGLAYFVENEGYKEHVLKSATQKDISTCSGFQTMAHAETKNSAGLRCTGIAMAICARHEFILPNGVGDLQKGERFCNIDFVVLSALYPLLVLLLLISYDIACQWKINFLERMEDLPRHLHIPEHVEIDYAIPKCHLPGHKPECHAPHSLNYKRCARCDGEGIERCWPACNRIAGSAKEMGPGCRHDTYDDHFGNHNWQKLVGFGSLLSTRTILAETQKIRHVQAHAAFTEALPDPKFEGEWVKMIEDWERDKTNANPYASVKTHISEDEIKQQLAEDELEKLSQGGQMPHETGPSAFLAMGLVLEETQRRIAAEAKNKEITTHELANLQQRRIQLHRRIRLFRELQRIYIPGAIRKIAAAPIRDQQPEDVTIWMPSQLDVTTQERGCYEGLVDMEIKLRTAQCQDSLDTIRMILRGRTSMLKFRNRNLTGQKSATRFGVAMQRMQQKLETCRARYNASRMALESLDPDGAWKSELQVLDTADMRMPGKEADTDIINDTNDPSTSTRPTKKKKTTLAEIAAPFVGEGYKTTSWIWTVSSAFGDGQDEQLNEALRVEWAKGRARQLRWSEEVLLLAEERRRILCTLDWKAAWWETRSEGWSGLDDAQVEGVRAYAMEQATIQRTLKEHFQRAWDKPKQPTNRNRGTEERNTDVIDPEVEALAEEMDGSDDDDE